MQNPNIFIVRIMLISPFLLLLFFFYVSFYIINHSGACLFPKYNPLFCRTLFSHSWNNDNVFPSFIRTNKLYRRYDGGRWSMTEVLFKAGRTQINGHSRCAIETDVDRSFSLARSLTFSLSFVNAKVYTQARLYLFSLWLTSKMVEDCVATTDCSRSHTVSSTNREVGESMASLAAKRWGNYEMTRSAYMYVQCTYIHTYIRAYIHISIIRRASDRIV